MKPIYIQTVTATNKLPVGSSRWWGNPDLPIDMEYPTYIDAEGDTVEMNFICQINLAEVADLRPDIKLPHKGLLSFFAKIDPYLGELSYEDCIKSIVSQTEEVKVIYLEDLSQLEELVLVDDEGEEISPKERAILFSENKECHEDHGLLMPPDHRQTETWESPYEKWEILLQVDSCEEEDFTLSFTDGGVLDFLISPRDLENQKFDQVRAIVLSS